ARDLPLQSRRCPPARLCHQQYARARSKGDVDDDAVTDIVLRAASSPAAISGTGGWAASLAGVAIFDLVQTAAARCGPPTRAMPPSHRDCSRAERRSEPRRAAAPMR